ncbi:transcription factor HES-2-like [Alosa alosa]|uniref:transcription factor HES-2-like n=1 Tax=Alosa alosa TaxID=278164 RepID=UPI0020154725|nr:transcription factor HES-2-like [Alosa alosa]
MKLQPAVHHVKIDRKLLKRQVERRRRERINRCLETLSKMLMQDSENQKRTEKAEILEHTVAFLRSNSHHDSNNSHNGFSTCLKRASEFLQTTELASNQKLVLSSRLDMVAVHQHHHHHHPLKQDVQSPLSPATTSKPLSPKSSTLKAALWNPRSPSSMSTVSPSHRRLLTPNLHVQPSTQASSPITAGYIRIGKGGCCPRQLLPPDQPMWRPWP